MNPSDKIPKVVSSTITHVTGSADMSEAAKLFQENPQLLQQVTNELCEHAREELRIARNRQHRFDSAFEILIYITIGLIVVAALLVLINMTTISVASGVVSIATGSGAAYLWNQVKNQRKFVEEKVKDVEKYCSINTMLKNMMQQATLVQQATLAATTLALIV